MTGKLARVHPYNTPSAHSSNTKQFGGNASQSSNDNSSSSSHITVSSSGGAPSSSSGSSSSASSGTSNSFAPLTVIKSLNKLPRDLFNIVNECLDDTSLVNLSITSRYCMTNTQREIDSRLMDYVVKGNEEKAREVIKSCPRLLTKKLPENNKVLDYSGKEIHGLTPLQAALCAGDVKMAEMMKPHILGLQDGKSELENQFEEIFPNGVEAKEQEQIAEVFDFSVIFDAIDNASDEDVNKELANINYKSANDALKADKETDTVTALQSALAKFRQAFDAKSKSEKIFNPQHLLAAFNYLNDNGRSLERYNMDGKHDLFWRQVIGYVQRHLPACYLQNFAQGIYYITEYKEASRRSLEFMHEQGHFMKADDILGELGFSWAGGQGSRRWQANFVWRDAVSDNIMVEADGCFSKIISVKKIRLGKIISSKVCKCLPRALARCVIS